MNSSLPMLQNELGPNERLLWSGQPRRGIRLRPADILFIPFSLLWAGFAVFWESSVINTGAPFFFKLWGIPFVLVGTYIVFGRFIVDAMQRDRTYYAVTDQRIIIISRLMTQKIKSLNLRTLSDISLDQRHDSSGTITFGPVLPMASWSAGMAWPGMAQYRPPGFEMVPDVKNVYEIIRHAQQQASQPGAWLPATFITRYD
jgi:hypothetical protein